MTSTSHKGSFYQSSLGRVMIAVMQGQCGPGSPRGGSGRMFIGSLGSVRKREKCIPLREKKGICLKEKWLHWGGNVILNEANQW